MTYLRGGEAGVPNSVRMLTPAFPDDEAQRLALLDSLALMYTPSEERFDRITRLASRLLGAPIALVTFVGGDSQWFKSSQGLGVAETPREISFCGHAILADETFVVEDASTDERFCDNPLVTGDPNIRFYAGHPVYAGDGSAIGTVCVIDRKPRTVRQEDLATLRDLAALVETELQREHLNDVQRELIADRESLERRASIDGLTRLWNRDTIMQLLAMEVSRASRGKPLSIAMIDADYFKSINDERGHPAGDAVLAEIAARIRGAVRDFDAVGRYGGDEFIAVLSDCRIDVAGAVCERIRKSIADRKIDTPGGIVSTSVTIGVAAHATTFPNVEEFVSAADQALYRAKKAGRNRIAFAGMDHPLQPPGMSSWRQRKRF